VRPLGAALAWIASAALFAVGLIAPLTPSEGCPSAVSLIVFAAVPALIPLGALPLVQHVLAKAALFTQSGTIAIIATSLLRTIHCLP